MFYLRDLPKFEALQARVNRYSQIDPRSVEVFLVLMRVSSDVLAGLETWLAQHGMSQGKFTLLMILNRDASVGMLPSELAERSAVTRATITGLLDGLERERLIKRQHHAEDRRKAVVRLTTQGIALIEKILPSYYELLASVMGELSAEDKKSLIELMVKINHGLPGLWAAAGKPRKFHLPEDVSSNTKTGA